MADGTKIEWTEATWNPITGCAVVSPGCTNCYAMGLAGTRLKHIKSRAGLTRDTKAGPVWTGETRFNEEWLDQPLRWKRPRTIFVCAHGDLFAESVPDAWIDRVFAVMALCPQHAFQVLTKRSARMRAYIESKRLKAPEWVHLPSLGGKVLLPYEGGWPTNVWLGVSAEDQKRADERIPDLLATPAAIRFVSAEPLLGPIDFFRIREATGFTFNALSRKEGIAFRATGLDWIIVGGESGPGARPMHPAWARSIRDQCEAAGVAFFFKQHGEWVDYRQIGGTSWMNATPQRKSYEGPTLGTVKHNDGRESGPYASTLTFGHPLMIRVGKKAAGRLLDGREHSAMPERAA